MLGLRYLQRRTTLKAPGLVLAGFGMCLALGDPLAPPALHQGALEEACGQAGRLQGPLKTPYFSVYLEYPDPWLRAAFPWGGGGGGVVSPPGTVTPLTGQTPAGVVQDSPQ